MNGLRNGGLNGRRGMCAPGSLNSINKSQSQFIVVDVFDGRRVETSDENTSTRTTESGNAVLAVSGHTPVLRNDRHARTTERGEECEAFQEEGMVTLTRQTSPRFPSNTTRNQAAPALVQRATHI